MRPLSTRQNDPRAISAEDLGAQFLELRPRLFGIAYHMLGSAWDAEDVVADAIVRWLALDRRQVREPMAFMTTVVTRLALDRLRSARAAREKYVGNWLPEPMLTEPPPLGPLDTVARREAVSLATLRMMEALTPPERAVLVLHEAFGLAHAEIADILGVTVEGARQHLRRARTRLTGEGKRFEAHSAAHEALFERFIDALEEGELDELQELLAADVVAYSDGGGKARAARYPITGVDRVAPFFRALRRHHAVSGVQTLEVNGQTAALFWFGRQYQLLATHERDGRIQEIQSIMNPDKLRYLQRQLVDRQMAPPASSHPL